MASSEDEVEALHVLGRAQTGPLLVDPSTALAQLVVWMLWSAVRSRDFAGCSELRSVSRRLHFGSRQRARERSTRSVLSCGQTTHRVGASVPRSTMM